MGDYKQYIAGIFTVLTFILTYFIVSVFSGFQFDELFIWTCLGIFSFGLKEKDDKTKK